MARHQLNTIRIAIAILGMVLAACRSTHQSQISVTPEPSGPRSWTVKIWNLSGRTAAVVVDGGEPLILTERAAYQFDVTEMAGTPIELTIRTFDWETRHSPDLLEAELVIRPKQTRPAGAPRPDPARLPLKEWNMRVANLRMIADDMRVWIDAEEESNVIVQPP